MAQRSESRAAGKAKSSRKQARPADEARAAAVRSDDGVSASQAPPADVQPPEPQSAKKAARGRKQARPADEVRRADTVASDDGVSAGQTPPADAETSQRQRPKKATRARKLAQPADEAAAELVPSPPGNAHHTPAVSDTPERGTSQANGKTKKPARHGKRKDAAASGRPSRSDASSRRRLPYLAAELGQPVDHNGEPIGAGSARLRSDRELQDYALQLWRQMQRGGGLRPQMKSIERAGLTIDDLWAAGVTEMQPTSSTSDEMKRYKQKLLFRANLLEAILSETVAELGRLIGIEPAPARHAGEPV